MAGVVAGGGIVSGAWQVGHVLNASRLDSGILIVELQDSQVTVGMVGMGLKAGGGTQVYSIDGGNDAENDTGPSSWRKRRNAAD